jgi:hypothetical protein
MAMAVMAQLNRGLWRYRNHPETERARSLVVVALTRTCDGNSLLCGFCATRIMLLDARELSAR